MGTQVGLAWKEDNGTEEYEYLFKWSYYPYYWDNFILEKHPNINTEGQRIKDMELLKTFKEWFLHLRFLFKYVVNSSDTSGKINWDGKDRYWDSKEGYLESIEEDLKAIEKALLKAQLLILEGKIPYLSIG